MIKVSTIVGATDEYKRRQVLIDEIDAAVKKLKAHRTEPEKKNTITFRRYTTTLADLADEPKLVNISGKLTSMIADDVVGILCQQRKQMQRLQESLFV